MKKILIIVLTAIFFKQLAWATFVPLWQFPDEQAHFGQVAWMVENGKREKGVQNLTYEIWLSENILGTLRDEMGNNKYTYHPEYNLDYSKTKDGIREKEIRDIPTSSRQKFTINEATGYPPLYYQLAAVIYKIFYAFDLFTRVFAVRIFTSLTLAGLTFIAYKIGQLIFENNFKALILAVLVGFQPMLSFVHAGVTSDALFNLLFGAFLYFVIRVIREIGKIWEIGGLFVIVYLAFLTKPQASIIVFVLGPVLGVLGVLGLLGRLGKLGKREAIVGILGFPLILFAGKEVINSLVSGNVLIPETQAGLVDPSVTVFEHLKFTLYHTYREVLPWYWGVFRWLSLGLPEIFRKITNWLTAFSFLGLGVYFMRVIRGNKKRKELIGIGFCLFVLLVYFAAVTVFDYGFRRSHGFSFGIQGRYFFPVIIAQMVIFIKGLESLMPGKFRAGLVKTLAVFMVLLNLTAFFQVTGSYYQLSLPDFFLQASQYKPVWLKSPVNAIILITALAGSLMSIWRILLLEDER